MRWRRTLYVAALIAGSVAAPGSGDGQEAPEAFEEVAKLVGADAGAADHAGNAVGIDGDHVVVGAWLHGPLDLGAAWVFERNEGGEWAEVAKLSASDGAPSDNLGITAAISGGTIVVGAVGDEDRTGSAYIFEQDESGEWIEVTKLLPPDGIGVVFSGSVAIQGDTVLVGDTANRGPPLGGAVYVFERDAGGPDNWGGVAKLGSEGGGRFGSSVSLDGERLVVGDRDDDDLGTNAGAAYVFERVAGKWVEVVKLTSSDGDGGDLFGNAVAVDGDIAVAGAYWDDDAGNQSGSAYVFERDERGRWLETAKLTASDATIGDWFGISVAVSENTAIVGAKLAGDGGSGSAYVFQRDTDGPGVWEEIAKLTASDGEELDFFGAGVAITDGITVVGAENADGGAFRSGAAYVFEERPCEVVLELEASAVASGGVLEFSLYLKHNRLQTVTVPLAFWIEDSSGEVVARRLTAPRTVHFGDELRRDYSLALPESLGPGRYELVVGIEQMQQGLAWAKRSFTVRGVGTVER